MKNRRLANVLILCAISPVFSGCSGAASTVDRKAFEDAAIVFHYFPVSPGGSVSFDAGPYKGGTAIIGPNELAFWVKDGEAYTVNQAAKDAASELEQAPDNVKFDDAFTAAVRSDAEKLPKRLARAMKELAEANTPQFRFYALNDAAKESFVAGNVEDAQKYADELMALLPKYKGDWNYGNAVQDANLVLGRIAVQEGRIEEGKAYLIEAGKSPGSPQMDSFGPNMSLAKDLLEKGEREVVLEYFELCRKFWEMDYGNLDKWGQQVKDGKIPGFGANLVY